MNRAGTAVAPAVVKSGLVGISLRTTPGRGYPAATSAVAMLLVNVRRRRYLHRRFFCRYAERPSGCSIARPQACAGGADHVADAHVECAAMLNTGNIDGRTSPLWQLPDEEGSRSFQ